MLREAASPHVLFFFFIFLHVLTFHFFFVTDSCRFKELTCAFKAPQRLILTCPASDRIWHARLARLIFRLDGLKWRKIHALNVLEILASKLFLLFGLFFLGISIWSSANLVFGAISWNWLKQHQQTNKQTNREEWVFTHTILYYHTHHFAKIWRLVTLFIKGLQYDVLRFLWYFLILQMKKGKH